MTALLSSNRLRVRDVVPWRRGAGLPPGQRELRTFPRFADDPLRRPPRMPDQHSLIVTGALGSELRLPLTVMAATLPRAEVIADFHCVTTWSVRDLRWGGVSFASFWRDIIVPTCTPATEAMYLVVEGLDGARAVLLLADALAEDVLLADQLNGASLDTNHGAPLRLVSPGQYGYKNIKHVHRFEIHTHLPASTYGPKEHLRARVALEERHSRYRPGLLRWVYRPLVPVTALLCARSALRGPR